MKKTQSFEDAIDRLEEIINILSTAEIALDESLELYSESAKLLSFCNKTLKSAKLSIEEIYPDQEQADEVKD